VLRATAEELSHVGYAALRVDEVARLSGVNKTTIYRRWPTKPELVAAAMRAIEKPSTSIDTGTLRGDLKQSLLEALALSIQPLGGGIMRILQTERAIPEIDSIAKTIRKEQHDARVAMVERGVTRGELPQGVDTHLVVDLVSGPVLRRALTFGELVSEAYVDQVLDAVLAGVAACGREQDV
jgi:AcrR family transcriptional regulator